MKTAYLFTLLSVFVALAACKAKLESDTGNAGKLTESTTKVGEKTSKGKEKLRVMMTSDFPPIGVVKSDDDIPNTQKSDPDDMQSMVRFLLYTNEFDIEGLVATAGTFAMEAQKKNILDVLDRYEMVEQLKTYDPDYPTADYLRSVTYEGLGNNHGIPIKWGHNKQLYTDIMGEGMGSTGVCEGDTPTFLWLISANRGINDPEDPAQPSWGGTIRSQTRYKPFC